MIMEIRKEEKVIVNFGDLMLGQVFRSPGTDDEARVDSDLFMKIEQRPWRYAEINTVRIKDGKTYVLHDYSKCVLVDGYFVEE
jgi:hypothetical protein